MPSDLKISPLVLAFSVWEKWIHCCDIVMKEVMLLSHCVSLFIRGLCNYRTFTVYSDNFYNSCYCFPKVLEFCTVA